MNRRLFSLSITSHHFASCSQSLENHISFIWFFINAVIIEAREKGSRVVVCRGGRSCRVVVSSSYDTRQKTARRGCDIVSLPAYIQDREDVGYKVLYFMPYGLLYNMAPWGYWRRHSDNYHSMNAKCHVWTVLNGDLFERTVKMMIVTSMNVWAMNIELRIFPSVDKSRHEKLYKCSVSSSSLWWTKLPNGISFRLGLPPQIWRRPASETNQNPLAAVTLVWRSLQLWSTCIIKKVPSLQFNTQWKDDRFAREFRRCRLLCEALEWIRHHVFSRRDSRRCRTGGGAD